MKFFKIYLPIIMIILMVSSTIGLAITADEIINKRDDNEYFQTARMEGEMKIVKGGRKMVKTMESISREGNSLVKFTNPRDRGTKFLKRGDNLFLFFPDAEDVVKLSGHMLNQGMMGSDFSYQDMMEADKLTELYNFKLLGEEKINDRVCYKLEGIAKEGKEVSYYRRLAWIDKKRFIGLREELYAQSGRLLKVSRVEKVDQIEERYFPVKTVMENKLRKNTETIFTIKSLDFNPEIPEGTFTLGNLQ